LDRNCCQKEFPRSHLGHPLVEWTLSSDGLQQYLLRTASGQRLASSQGPVCALSSLVVLVAFLLVTPRDLFEKSGCPGRLEFSRLCILIVATRDRALLGTAIGQSAPAAASVVMDYRYYPVSMCRLGVLSINSRVTHLVAFIAFIVDNPLPLSENTLVAFIAIAGSPLSATGGTSW
jgi:hypothetical protein